MIENWNQTFVAIGHQENSQREVGKDRIVGNPLTE